MRTARKEKLISSLEAISDWCVYKNKDNRVQGLLASLYDGYKAILNNKGRFTIVKNFVPVVYTDYLDDPEKYRKGMFTIGDMIFEFDFVYPELRNNDLWVLLEEVVLEWETIKGAFEKQVKEDDEIMSFTPFIWYTAHCITDSDETPDFDVKVREDKPFTVPNTIPVKEGYKFEYWYETGKPSTEKYVFDTLLTSDISLTAKWS